MTLSLLGSANLVDLRTLRLAIACGDYNDRVIASAASRSEVTIYLHNEARKNPSAQ